MHIAEPVWVSVRVVILFIVGMLTDVRDNVRITNFTSAAVPVAVYANVA